MGIVKYFLCCLAMVCLGCSGDDNSSSGEGGSGGTVDESGNPIPKNRVNWNQVPSEFNPKIDEEQFSLEGANIIKLDILGFSKDVEVVYSNDVNPGTAVLKIYEVSQESVAWGRVSNTLSGNKLHVERGGNYKCGIQIENGIVQKVEGRCIVRLQIVLSNNAIIEVYNLGKRITESFFPMDNSEFLEQFEDATWSEDKFKIIDGFVNSHSKFSKIPSLVAPELLTVLKGFIRSEEKFTALRRLHSYVADRESLNSVIDEGFSSSFDKKDAKEIVGI